jgi:site-specific DNA recombinase
MAVAIYCRVSTEEQRERQSILTQREFGERYTELHRLPVYALYADDGISGTVPLEGRPEGARVLKDARAGKFDQLLIFKLDRLGRETRLILNAVAELEKLGVRVRSMTEEFDTASATGRLMLTMLSGFATHEREQIRERSVAGTRRVAEAGAWLGGIVPYGYRKVGEKRDARLVVSDEIIPDVGISEADVVREIFRLAAGEKLSCRKIAVRLNEMRVPCAYTRDEKLFARGKRRHRTLGVWRGPRVRCILSSKTYMGVHEFGKRTSSKRPVVSRSVPAIVTEGTWKKAQANLKAHFLFSARSAKYKYLLRGLIKCKLCGLTYIGMKANGNTPSETFYYKCNGAHTPELLQVRCAAKAVRGDDLEKQVWADVETFLRNPGPVLAQIQARLESDAGSTAKIRERLKRLEGLRGQKEAERSRVLALYRRGRLNDAGLDDQMEEIQKEEAALEAQIEELKNQVRGADSISQAVSSAEALLTRLRKRLDQPISWELKRQIIEVLVAGIEVETVEVCGVKQARTTVTYRFSLPEEPARVLLPTSYASARRCVRIPIEPKTVGDHIRRKRLAAKLLQKDVAERIGVDKGLINNWECNHSSPHIRFIPAVIRFLGYNPLPVAKNWAERLVRHRTTLGFSQNEAARRIGVDPSTLARWERGEREPAGALAKPAQRFLDGTDGHESCGEQGNAGLSPLQFGVAFAASAIRSTARCRLPRSAFFEGSAG